MAFTKGMNGLNAAAKNLEVISNNVANSGTIGFKAGQLYFSEVLANSQGGGAGSNASSGASSVKVMPQFTQGNIGVTNNPLDLAIKGQGMFTLKDSDMTFYSRAGQFQQDAEGYVATAAGARLQGWQVDDSGAVATSAATDILIPKEPLSPKATTKAGVVLNLDARKTVGDPAAFSISDPVTYQHATSVQINDTLGKEHSLGLFFVKNAESKWDVFASADGAQIGSGAIGSLSFQANGDIDTTASPQPMSITTTLADGSTTTFDLDLSGTTQLGRDFTVASTTNDGRASGQMTSFTFDSEGYLVGRYSNGSSRKIAQVALAMFNNPQALQLIGSNGFAATAESGLPKLQAPGSSTAGTIQSGALEQSNVDLTSELVKLIEAQRAYQANAQAIKAQDAIMQATENLR